MFKHPLAKIFCLSELCLNFLQFIKHLPFAIPPSRAGRHWDEVLVSSSFRATAQGVEINAPLRLGDKRGGVKTPLAMSVMCRQYLLNSHVYWAEKDVKMTILHCYGNRSHWIMGGCSKVKMIMEMHLCLQVTVYTGLFPLMFPFFAVPGTEHKMLSPFLARGHGLLKGFYVSLSTFYISEVL